MSDVLLSLRAGLLRLEGRTLTADARKGILEIISTPSRLAWVPETSRTSEEFSVPLSGAKIELELLPGPQRAVSVRKNGERTAFFWLQDPDKSEGADERRVSEFNALLERLCADGTQANALPAMVLGEQQSETSAKPVNTSDLSSASMLSRLNAFAAAAPQSQQQQSFLSLLNAMAARDQAPNPAGASLQNYFSSVLQSQAAAAPKLPPDSDLEEILAPDNVWDYIKDDDEVIESLYPFMPEQTRNKEGLRELVYSAQFRQIVQILQIVIRNGDAAPLLAEMQLPLDAQGPGNGVTAFLRVCCSFISIVCSFIHIWLFVTGSLEEVFQ